MTCPECGHLTFSITIVNEDQMLLLHCTLVGCPGFIEVEASPYGGELEIRRD